MRTRKVNLIRRIIHSLYCRLHSVINFRILHFDTIILYEHKELKEISSPAVIKNVDYHMLPDILSFQDKKYLELFKNFLENGDQGYFAYLDGKCVHRTWVKLGPQEVNLHHFWKKSLKENELFIHYCETAEEARGKSIYPGVLAKIVKDFKEKYTIYISTSLKNQASIKAIEKAGFKEKERKKITAFLGLKQIKIIPTHELVKI